MNEIDEGKVPSKEIYQKFVESFNKTELYLSLWFEYRELWVRKRDLLKKGNTNFNENHAYNDCQERFEDILEKWKQYPEERKYWGISKEVFERAECRE